MAIEKGFPCTLTIYESEGRRGEEKPVWYYGKGGGCLWAELYGQFDWFLHKIQFSYCILMSSVIKFPIRCMAMTKLFVNFTITWIKHPISTFTWNLFVYYHFILILYHYMSDKCYPWLDLFCFLLPLLQQQ